MSIHFKNFVALETERFLLRQLVIADEPAIYTLRSDDRVNEFLDRPRTQSIEEAGKFIEKINTGIERHEWLYWVIVFKESPQTLLGTISLWNFSADNSVAELGYELLPQQQGKGIMQESLRAVIDFAFDNIKLKQIKAFTHINNRRSFLLLEKFNFKIKTPDVTDGTEDELKNMIVYSLSRDNS